MVIMLWVLEVISPGRVYQSLSQGVGRAFSSPVGWNKAITHGRSAQGHGQDLLGSKRQPLLLKGTKEDRARFGPPELRRLRLQAEELGPGKPRHPRAQGTKAAVGAVGGCLNGPHQRDSEVAMA